ncbi:38602_t:CDS:10, partial [Gigaspora margarita]
KQEILFQWTNFGEDSFFATPQTYESHPNKFSSFYKYIQAKYNYTGKISVPYLLGLTCTENVVWLRSFIATDEIDKELADSTNSIIFKAGLPMSSKGLDLEEISNSISDNESTNDSINSESLSCIFEELIGKGKLGSSILVSTKVYLELILNKPCSVCGDKDIINHKYTIQVFELSIRITIICSNCGTQTDHHNEVSDFNFSRAISATRLVRGMNREEIRTILSLIGVTYQSSVKQYFQYQDLFLNEVVGAANKNAEQNLHEISFHVVEKPRQYETKNAKIITINEGNYNSSSKQMEHAILITIIDKITPILEEYNIVLDIKIDGDLDSNKTLANQTIVHKIFGDLKHKSKLIRNKIANHVHWKHFEQPIMKFYCKCVYVAIILCWIVKNPDLELGEPNLTTYNDIQYKDLEDLITTIRTSANEAINCLKLNYTDKKTDYPKSFAARHALAVLHNNVGLLEMLNIVRSASDLCEFSDQNIYNISKIQEQREYRRTANIVKIETRNQTHAQKIINQKACLSSFNFGQDLVPYGQIIQQSLKNVQFHPSFATKIPNFETIIKCNSCQSFPIRYSNGLCLISNQAYQKINDIPNSKNIMLNAIISEVFGFTKFRPKQQDSINCFIEENDTLCILPTSGGKTLVYAVVFTPLKALMEDQIQELVNKGIPLAMLYASSEQLYNVQKAIFSEIASGFIRILLVIPEKYIKNLAFACILQNIARSHGLQFVIDEAHCINNYAYFQNDWTKLSLLKQNFPSSPIFLLTTTCSKDNIQKILDSLGLSDLKIFQNPTIYRSEIRFKVLNKLVQKENQSKILIDLISSVFSGQCIVYSATINDYQSRNLEYWKSNKLKLICTTTAFGMSLNVSDVYTVIHTTFSISIDALIQEAGRAGSSKSDNSPIVECENCDNCDHQIKDDAYWYNVEAEANRMVKIAGQVISLQQSFGSSWPYIKLDDILDVFMGSKSQNAKKKNLTSLEDF